MKTDILVACTRLAAAFLGEQYDDSFTVFDTLRHKSARRVIKRLSVIVTTYRFDMCCPLHPKLTSSNWNCTFKLLLKEDLCV